MKNTKRIQSIKVQRVADSDPDTSYLGTFSNRAYTQFAIDHCERTGSNRTNGQWFNPGTVEDFKESASWIPTTVENKRQYWHDAMVKNAEADYARMIAFSDGQWEYIGIRATAEVVIAGTCQTVTSGGLWGIESDSDAAYLQEIEAEQVSELRTILYGMGFSKRSIAAAVKAGE